MEMQAPRWAPDETLIVPIGLVQALTADFVGALCAAIA